MPAARVIVTNRHHTVILVQRRNYVDKVTCFAQRAKNDCIRVHSKKVQNRKVVCKMSPNPKPNTGEERK
jgi:hypothetical protein